MYEKFISPSLKWNSFQNTWTRETKMCNEGLGIQTNKKVGIPRTPVFFTRMENSEAQIWTENYTTMLYFFFLMQKSSICIYGL